MRKVSSQFSFIRGVCLQGGRVSFVISKDICIGHDCFVFYETEIGRPYLILRGTKII